MVIHMTVKRKVELGFKSAINQNVVSAKKSNYEGVLTEEKKKGIQYPLPAKPQGGAQTRGEGAGTWGKMGEGRTKERNSGKCTGGWHKLAVFHASRGEVALRKRLALLSKNRFGGEGAYKVDHRDICS